MTQHTPDESRRKVHDLISSISVAQMVTVGRDGRLHSRPMVGQQLDHHDELWFFTGAGSSKTDEIDANAEVLLTYSDPSRQHYVAVRGTAHIVRDPSKIHELWPEPLRTWFPKGPDDPEIALIRVSIRDADYWDSPSSTLVHVYGYAKALLTGERPNPGENEHVEFNSR